MKSRQLEILLFTDTRFSSKAISEKGETPDQNYFIKYNALEEACWNGLFQEMVSLLGNEQRKNDKMVLWKVTRADHFLELEYGEYLQQMEKPFSMNPYCFLQAQQFS